MTYLELINNVLTRLREDTIEDSQVDSDPFYRSIGAHVNDAKDRVEDSWQWGALRGTDAFELPPGQGAVYSLPESDDRHYILKRAYFQRVDDSRPEPAQPNSSQYYPARQLTIDGIRQRYLEPSSVSPGQPFEFSIVGDNPSTGLKQVQIFPPPEGDEMSSALAEWQMVVDRARHQKQLVDPTDRLLVPSLPVYTLATALASRERGEVGGTPTSELFAIADRHLSDAIAQDSALYLYDTDWSSGYYWNRTNFRTA